MGMVQSLAADIARKSFDVLLERAVQPRVLSYLEMQELLDGCAIPFATLDRLWQSAQEALDRGVERQQFLATLYGCRDVLELAGRSLAAVRERVQGADILPKDRA